MKLLSKLLGKRAEGGIVPRYYGGSKTIHSTTALDVEVAENGEVVAVWFRCQMLPFRAVDVDERRASDMRSIDKHVPLPGIVGVELLDG